TTTSSVNKMVDGEDAADGREAADHLRHDLTRTAVEDPGHGAPPPVPAPAIVARAVGEEAYRQDAPEPARAVHRDRPDRVVDLHDPLDELDAQPHQTPDHHSEH